MRTLLISIILAIIAVSCTSHNKTIQVPVELPSNFYHYDSRIRDIVIKDSVSRWTEGDTVYIYREKTKLVNIADTLIKRDSISTAVILETIDELNIEYLDKLNGLKSLMLKMITP